MDGRHPSWESLFAFVTGGLAAEDALRIERHLDTCPACESQTEEIAVLARLLFEKASHG